MKRFLDATLLLFGLVLFCNCERIDSQTPPPPLDASAIVHVDIESSVQSTFISQQHLEVPVKQLFGEGLRLKPLVTLKGTAPLGADVVAFAKSDGLLKSRGHLRAEVDNGGLFTLNLVAGQSYYLIVNPAGRALSPPAFFEVKLDADATVQYALPTRGPRVLGTIKFQTQMTAAQLAPKLWIRVMQDNRQVSSLGRINESGEFSVFLSEPLFQNDLKTHPLELLVEHSSDLNFLATKHIVLPFKSQKDDISVDPIDLGPTQPLIDAQVVIASDDNAPVREARLVVRSLVQDGFIQATTMSDSKGMAHVLIPMGKYDVAVVPKHDDPMAFKKMKEVDFSSTTPINIRLEKRGELRVQISDVSGTPVALAQVLLTRIAKAESNTRENILDAAELRLEARSNNQGQVCLLQISILSDMCQPIRLDSGRYRVTVIPPAGSPYPYFTKVFDFPEIAELSISIKKAILLTGKLIGPTSNSVVPRSFIRIFSPQIEKESGTPIFLSQAFSLKDGTFSVVIPGEFAFSPPIKGPS